MALAVRPPGGLDHGTSLVPVPGMFVQVIEYFQLVFLS